ncbi:MAG: sodium:solute symporter family protein [Myxococcota bacterium]
MSVLTWTYIIVGLTFAIYIGIAIWSRAGSTKEFYVAGGGVPPVANGMATAADWMSAASFISMAGLISFLGYDGSMYLMGWTGGYVLLALLLAPYLRKFGKFTVPDFVGDRYYSSAARIVAVVCAIIVSFTYVAGQMRGVGVVFARFLEVDITTGIVIGMAMVFFYATLGGMKGITYTQVAQYVILIFAFMVPAIFISLLLTGMPIPQLGFGWTLGGEVGSQLAAGESVYLLDKLNQLHADLGFPAYTDAKRPMLDFLCITIALMVGTAGLPHVIVRFYTVPKVRDARASAFWALIFIGLLYTTAPAVAAFARTNLIGAVTEAKYDPSGTASGEEKIIPGWFYTWEKTGLLAWVDKNGDGKVQYKPGAAFKGKPKFKDGQGSSGERLVTNDSTDNGNELYVDRDIIVLANPEIARLPNWVVALVAAGGLAAALSTAAGLLLVVSTSISHDLLKNVIAPDITEAQELMAARGAAVVAVLVAGYLGIYPPGFVAQVVAIAFGLAASSFFPVIIMGIFSKRMNREGALAGMISGIGFTLIYIFLFKSGTLSKESQLFGISPEGIGTIGMVINFVVANVVSRFTPPPPADVQEIVESVRIPKGASGPSAGH